MTVYDLHSVPFIRFLNEIIKILVLICENFFSLTFLYIFTVENEWFYPQEGLGVKLPASFCFINPSAKIKHDDERSSSKWNHQTENWGATQDGQIVVFRRWETNIHRTGEREADGRIMDSVWERRERKQTAERKIPANRQKKLPRSLWASEKTRWRETEKNMETGRGGFRWDHTRRG